MTMVEKVARAIAAVDGTEDWKCWVNEARAAIQAMREPTETMERAGWDAHSAESVLASSTDAFDCWSAMINAALSDGNIANDT